MTPKGLELLRQIHNGEVVMTEPEIIIELEKCCEDTYKCEHRGECDYLFAELPKSVPIDRKYCNPTGRYRNDDNWIPQASLPRLIRQLI